MVIFLNWLKTILIRYLFIKIPNHRQIDQFYFDYFIIEFVLVCLFLFSANHYFEHRICCEKKRWWLLFGFPIHFIFMCNTCFTLLMCLRICKKQGIAGPVEPGQEGNYPSAPTPLLILAEKEAQSTTKTLHYQLPLQISRPSTGSVL